MKEVMISRDRVMTALEHKETDRVPFSLGFGINEPARRELMTLLKFNKSSELNEYLNGLIDIIGVATDYIGPQNRNRTEQNGINTDIWGVRRKPVSYGKGSYKEIIHYPLADASDINDLEMHEWPSADWIDTSTLANKIRRIRRHRNYAIQSGGGNIFETSWYMRGFEQMLMDLLINPELAWEIMTRVTDYYINQSRKILEAAEGMIDIFFTADDIGQQQGLLMSLEIWEKMIKPHHVRLNKALHEYGVKIMYHTDGAVMDAIPGLIDMKIDILEALQFDAKGMDPDTLKSLYGSSLCFHGGISVQTTLPFGKPEDVRREVRQRVQVLGNAGGYILAPSHAIQAGTPPENIDAFLNESKGMMI